MTDFDKIDLIFSYNNIHYINDFANELKDFGNIYGF